MAEQKTKPTTVRVKDFLDAIENDERRKDCRTLSALMKKVTGATPKMWGGSIVGFGTYHYKYASGHEGDSCIVGFAPRTSDISVYLVPGREGAEAQLAKLGKHKIGKSCLHIKRLADVDLPVLEALVTRSVAETRRRYPG